MPAPGPPVPAPGSNTSLGTGPGGPGLLHGVGSATGPDSPTAIGTSSKLLSLDSDKVQLFKWENAEFSTHLWLHNAAGTSSQLRFKQFLLRDQSGALLASSIPRVENADGADKTQDPQQFTIPKFAVAHFLVSGGLTSDPKSSQRPVGVTGWLWIEDRTRGSDCEPNKDDGACTKNPDLFSSRRG